jgi:hypothetical protein
MHGKHSHFYIMAFTGRTLRCASAKTSETIQKPYTRKFLDFHGRDYWDCGFLDCDIAQSYMQIPAFLRNMLPQSSVLKSPYNHEDVGSMFIRNAGIRLQD